MKDTIFIPGKELLDHFEKNGLIVAPVNIFEVSFVDMFNNIKAPNNFNTKKRQFSTQPLTGTEIKITPYKGTKSLLMRTIINSDSGKQYQTSIMFTRVKYVDDIEDVDDPNSIVEFMASDGEEYAIERIDLKKNDVKVRCECLDFRWRFADYNASKKALYGRKPPPYVPKGNRPPVNPNHVPGVCKHLIKSFEIMMESGLTTMENTNV